MNTVAHKHVILGDADSRRTGCFYSLRQPQLPSGDGKKQNASRQKTVERFYKEKMGLILQRKLETGKRVTIFFNCFHDIIASVFNFFIVHAEPIKADHLSANKILTDT